MGQSLRKVIGYVLIILMIIDALISTYAALRAPYPGAVPLGSPMAYRNIYLHVPIAWATYTLFVIGFILSILYLITQNKKFDKYASLFIYTGIVYAFMVLATGSAWAAESWGSFWNWDPRETGVLILFIAYLVYVALRRSIKDPERRAMVSAVYAVAAFATVPISFIMPYVASGSLHPTMKTTEGFITQPSVAKIFFTKALLTTIISILIPIAIGIGLKREFMIGAIIAAAILFVGSFMAFPWGASGRVVEVKLLPGNMRMIAYGYNGKEVIKGYLKVLVSQSSKNLTVTVTSPNSLPKPEFIAVPKFAKGSKLVIEYRGQRFWPTLLGHIVRVEKHEVVPLNPVCIAWTLFVYGVGFLILAYILPRVM